VSGTEEETEQQTLPRGAYGGGIEVHIRNLLDKLGKLVDNVGNIEEAAMPLQAIGGAATKREELHDGRSNG
jgi:hypothetical protein